MVLHTTGIVLPIEVILLRFKAKVCVGAIVARFCLSAGAFMPEEVISEVVAFGRKGTLAEICFCEALASNLSYDCYFSFSLLFLSTNNLRIIS